MAPVKIKLEPHYKGDWWVGMLVGPVLINGAQPAATLTSVAMEFRDENDVLGHKFSSAPGAGEGTITISDAATWEVIVPEQLLDLDAGTSQNGSSNKKTWYWDFETTDSDGVILTLYKGTIKVLEDVTA